MNHFTLNLPPDSEGFYGKFGGTFVPDILRPNITALKEAYLKYIDDPDFQEEFDKLMRDYVGRPTPLYYAKRLSEKYGTNVYLKREDLNHTGAHKINNAIGQVLLAKRMGKHRVIAETGAGQHGVATATVCALMGMECTVYMGKLDVDRQRPNVERMKMLGANVVPVTKGSATLADAVDVALMDWCENPDETFYLLGSAVGPDPYPQMVARFQSIISEEIKQQLLQLTGKPNPDYVIACIGGGSNASGAFYHFIPEENVQLNPPKQADLALIRAKQPPLSRPDAKASYMDSRPWSFLTMTETSRNLTAFPPVSIILASGRCSLILPTPDAPK